MATEEVNDDLAKIPVQEVEVKTQPTALKTVIGSEEFIKEISKLLKEGSVWRTPEGLASKLSCDVADLSKWLDKVQEVCSRPGKDDKVYYALVSRLEKPDEKKNQRPVIEEQDRYITAMLHMTYGNLLSILQKYSIRIHDKNPEAFTMLMHARDKMSAGLVLIEQTLRSDTNKLPRLPEQ